MLAQSLTANHDTCVFEMSVLSLHQGINVVLRAMCLCMLPLWEWSTQTQLRCFSKNRNATNRSTNWYFLSLGLFHPTPLARRLKLEVLRTPMKPSFKKFFKNPTSSDHQSDLRVTDPKSVFARCCCFQCLSQWLFLSTMADCKFSYTVGNVKHIPLKDLRIALNVTRRIIWGVYCI